MNKKAIAVIVATSSLFIGAGILVVGKSSPERKKAPSSAEAGNPETSRPISSEAPSAIRNRRGRPAKPVAMRDLEERYGEARAKRAARVGSTYLRVLDSTISYAERSGPYDASFNISEAELGPLFDRLNLSEDQEVEMEKIFQGHSYEEARKMKAFAEKMRQDTPALIEAILASDAYARGAIDKAAYEAATQPAYQALVAAGAGKTPLGSLSAGEPGEASRNRNQPEVQRKIRQILKPDQVGELDAYLDENQIDPTGSAPPSLANVLPLEKLEEVERGMDARAAIMEHTEALMNELEKLKPSEGK